MKPADIFRENAENCAELAAAEPNEDGPAYKRYKRMEASLGERAGMAGRGNTTSKNSRGGRTQKPAQVRRLVPSACVSLVVAPMIAKPLPV